MILHLWKGLLYCPEGNIIICTPCDTTFKNLAEKKEKGKHQPYSSLVGCFLRVSRCSSQDIAFLVTQISQYLQPPTTNTYREALLGSKRNLSFFVWKQWMQVWWLAGWRYKKHADWAQDLTDRKSTTGSVYWMGKVSILWSSKKQDLVAS